MFPKGLEDRYNGVGTPVIEENYVLYFKPNTPRDIIDRLTKDYAEYYRKQIDEYGIFQV